MTEYEKKLSCYGIRIPDILLPKRNVDMGKWAVVACDQYTSERNYWQEVEKLVGNNPSTLNIIFPECYLEDDGKKERIENINRSMEEYLAADIFDEYKKSFILVKRTTESGTRYGLMLALDLECYDYSKDSVSLIRATEGTILDRIPPRKEIRKNAVLESPHIMVLISDKERSVIEPFIERLDELECVYDTDLMMKGGHISGYLVNAEEDIALITDGFENLYKALDEKNPLLFAMGDGNHSLATAKSLWEDVKKDLDEEERKYHPARFALVEIENIYDEGLMFEPIHRVFFNTDSYDFDQALLSVCKACYYRRCYNLEELIASVNEKGTSQRFGYIRNGSYMLCELESPKSFLAAGTIQSVIDSLLKSEKGQVDYIHGAEVTEELAAKDGNNIGIILPDVSKDTFFQSILKDKAFPRKTFSIGHANEKRYYMEARRIKK